MFALRFVARSLLKRPGYVASVTLVLGLATGSALAAGMLVDALLLRPLPLLESESLFTLHRHMDGISDDGFTYHEYENIAENVTGVMDIASGAGRDSLLMITGSVGRQVAVDYVTERFFDMIEMRPAHGRGFVADDFKGGASPVAVVTHAFWQATLAGDPDALGQTITVGDGTATVVGILPRGFRGLSVSEPVGLFVPIAAVMLLSPRADMLLGLGGNTPTSWIRVTVRLKVGVNARRAGTHFTAVMNHDRPRDRGAETVVLVPLAQAALSPYTRAETLRFVALLVTACGILLFAGCANAAVMMMVRNEQRRHEVATLISLGVRWGGMQLRMFEALALTGFGAVAGMLVAVLLLQMARGFVVLPGGVALTDLDTEWTLLEMGLGTLAMAVMVAACVSVAGLQRKAPSRQRYGRILAVQMAVVVVLMVGAGLFVESVRATTAVSSSRSDGLVYVGVRLPAARAENIYRSVHDRLAGIPGIGGVTFGDIPLGGASSTLDLVVDGDERQVPRTYLFGCGPDYMQTVGVEMLAGRDFRPNDPAAGAIISEALARLLWGDEDPIGRRLAVDPWSDGAVDVIGVVRDGRYARLRDVDRLAVFLPWRVATSDPLAMARTTIAVRSGQDGGAVLPVVQRVVQEADPDVLIMSASTHAERVRGLSEHQRVAATLLVVLGGFALLIAVLGVFGAVAYTVASRMKEIAIRIALGAGWLEVMRVTLAQTLAHAGVGIGIGICAAVAFAKKAEPHLLEVSPYDAATYAAVVAVVVGVTLCAGMAPTVRAVRVDALPHLKAE